MTIDSGNFNIFSYSYTMEYHYIKDIEFRIYYCVEYIRGDKKELSETVYKTFIVPVFMIKGKCRYRYVSLINWIDYSIVSSKRTTVFGDPTILPCDIFRLLKYGVFI